MPIAIACPRCQRRMNAPEAAVGHTVICPACKAPLIVPRTPATAPAPVPPAPAPSADGNGSHPAAALESAPPTLYESPRPAGPRWGPWYVLVARIVLASLWACYFCVAGVVVLWYLVTIKAQTSAVQESAVAAMGCFWQIALYCLMRAVDKATHALVPGL